MVTVPPALPAQSEPLRRRRRVEAAERTPHVLTDREALSAWRCSVASASSHSGCAVARQHMIASLRLGRVSDHHRGDRISREHCIFDHSDYFDTHQDGKDRAGMRKFPQNEIFAEIVGSRPGFTIFKISRTREIFEQRKFKHFSARVPKSRPTGSEHRDAVWPTRQSIFLPNLRGEVPSRHEGKDPFGGGLAALAARSEGSEGGRV